MWGDCFLGRIPKELAMEWDAKIERLLLIHALYIHHKRGR